MIWQLEDYTISEESRFEDVIAVKISNNKSTYRKNYTIKDNNIYIKATRKIKHL